METIPKKHDSEREQSESLAGSVPLSCRRRCGCRPSRAAPLLRGPYSSSELSRCALSLRAAQRGSRGQCSAHVPCAQAGRQAGSAVACRASFTGDASSASARGAQAAGRPAAAPRQPQRRHSLQAVKPTSQTARRGRREHGSDSAFNGLLARRELRQRSRSARVPSGRFTPPPLSTIRARRRALNVLRIWARLAAKPVPR